MFYCEGCAYKRGWPYEDWTGQSRGPCETCGRVAYCVDVPSSSLPIPKKEKK